MTSSTEQRLQLIALFYSTVSCFLLCESCCLHCSSKAYSLRDNLKQGHELTLQSSLYRPTYVPALWEHWLILGLHVFRKWFSSNLNAHRRREWFNFAFQAFVKYLSEFWMFDFHAKC